MVSIAEYQAARFSQHCRMFAPVYRQSTMASLVLGLVGLPRQRKGPGTPTCWPPGATTSPTTTTGAASC